MRVNVCFVCIHLDILNESFDFESDSENRTCLHGRANELFGTIVTVHHHL